MSQRALAGALRWSVGVVYVVLQGPLPVWGIIGIIQGSYYSPKIPLLQGGEVLLRLNNHHQYGPRFLLALWWFVGYLKRTFFGLLDPKPFVSGGGLT